MVTLLPLFDTHGDFGGLEGQHHASLCRRDVRSGRFGSNRPAQRSAGVGQIGLEGVGLGVGRVGRDLEGVDLQIHRVCSELGIVDLDGQIVGDDLEAVGLRTGCGGHDLRRVGDDLEVIGLHVQLVGLDLDQSGRGANAIDHVFFGRALHHPEDAEDQEEQKRDRRDDQGGHRELVGGLNDRGLSLLRERRPGHSGQHPRELRGSRQRDRQHGLTNGQMAMVQGRHRQRAGDELSLTLLVHRRRRRVAQGVVGEVRRERRGNRGEIQRGASRGLSREVGVTNVVGRHDLVYVIHENLQELFHAVGLATN